MHRPSTEKMTALLAAHKPPCVSLYMPTERSYPANQQGPVRFRNLLRKVEEALQPYPSATTRALLGRMEPLLDDPFFWTHRLDGLAAFASADLFETIDLRRPVAEQLIVADSFHVKPLLRRAQTSDRFQVLCLTRSRVRMLEGDRDGLDEIDLAGVPATVEEALGTGVGVQRGEQTQGGKSPGEPHPRPTGQLPGHPQKGNDAKLDDERFFRAVDQAVWEHHSRRSGLPLLLAALPEHQARFRAHTHNQLLLPRGVEQNPEAMADDQLREAAWKVVEPFHEERMKVLIESFQTARARKMGTDSLEEAARAAHDGRVGMLLIDADYHVPGRLDPQTGLPALADPAHNGHDDLLDDLGELVLRMKGEVLVLPGKVMPTPTGLAAVYRY